MSLKQNQITIVGGGLVGPLLGIYMAQRGMKVDIFQKRSDMRQINMIAGRSINLSLSKRGMDGLYRAGMGNLVQDILIPMKGRMIHSTNGELNFQRYGAKPNCSINSLSRGELNQKLMTECEKLGVNIHFNKSLTNFDLQTGQCEFIDEITQKVTNVSDTTIIGADGWASLIRQQFFNYNRFSYSQQSESHGYQELTLPPAQNGSSKFLIDPNSLHIWPRGRFMLIALPNTDGNFTCTLFLDHEGATNSFEALNTKEKIGSFFQQYFPDVIPLMPNLIEQFAQNPIGVLGSIKCNPWHYKNKVCLIGDAAHAMVPFYGQGMNCGFEDCVAFDAAVGQHGDNWEAVFKHYFNERQANADSIVDMALENFKEMRDHVASQDYLLRREAELLIEEKYQDFTTRYGLISFTTTPYKISQQKGNIHKQVLNEMCQGIDSVSQFNVDVAYNQIKELYQQNDLPY